MFDNLVPARATSKDTLNHCVLCAEPIGLGAYIHRAEDGGEVSHYFCWSNENEDKEVLTDEGEGE